MSEVPVPTQPAAVTTPPPPAPPAQRSRPIAGWVLIFLGALFLADNVLPSVGAWIAPGLFAAAGIGFLAWFGARPQHPWPIIVGGSLLSLAAVMAWNLYATEGGGTVLFAGLAATFLAYAAVPPAVQHRSWGYWVAGACLLVAVLATGFSWAWPLALIAIGAWLLLRRGAGLHA